MFTKEKSKADNRSDVYLHDFPTDLWKQIKVSAVLKGVTVVEVSWLSVKWRSDVLR